MRRLALSVAVLLCALLLTPAGAAAEKTAKTAATSGTAGATEPTAARYDVGAVRLTDADRTRLLAALPARPTTTRAPQAGCPHGAVHTSGTDGSALDVRTYGAHYGCAAKGEWYVELLTSDSWTPDRLKGVAFAADTDGSPETGCGGFEWYVYGTWQASVGKLVAGVYASPTCDSEQWRAAANAGIGTNGSGLALTFAHADLGGGPTLTWYAGVAATSDTAAEDLPARGSHVESGFLSPPDPCGTAARSHYLRTRDPDAVPALRAAGLSGVRRVRGGVVAFEGDAATARRALARADVVARVRPDVVRRLHALPRDPQLSSQWGLDAVRAAGAWKHTTGSRDVVVAVLDSGIDAAHPDLAGQLLPGYDATTGGPLAAGNTDSVGHGTAVAGVVAAATDNGVGLASLGWRTRVLPVKVSDPDGTIRTTSLANGIRYAADAGARVLSISLGSCGRDAVEEEAVRYAQGKGVLVVASAGNEKLEGNPVEYPGAYDGVLAVGATAPDDTVAPYSSTGPHVDLVAPGGAGDRTAAHDVLMLRAGGGTFTASGTSFSAPLVAAAAALVHAVRPDLRGTALGAALTSTARDVGADGRDDAYGAGVLDAGAALDAVVLDRPSGSPTPQASAPASSLAPSTTLTPPDGGSATPTPAASGPSAAPTGTPAGTPSPAAPASGVPDEATPALLVSSATVPAGSAVTARVRTRPGVAVALYGYSRPATAFRLVRSGVAGADGSVAWSLGLPANTRLLASVTGPSGRAVASRTATVGVTSRVSVAAVRTARLAYRFSGSTLPARSGVLVTVYDRASGRALGATRTTAGGRWALPRRFAGRTTATVLARTGGDALNAGGSSAPLRVVVR